MNDQSNGGGNSLVSVYHVEDLRHYQGPVRCDEEKLRLKEVTRS